MELDIKTERDTLIAAILCFISFIYSAEMAIVKIQLILNK